MLIVEIVSDNEVLSEIKKFIFYKNNSIIAQINNERYRLISFSSENIPQYCKDLVGNIELIFYSNGDSIIREIVSVISKTTKTFSLQLIYQQVLTYIAQLIVNKGPKVFWVPRKGAGLSNLLDILTSNFPYKTAKLLYCQGDVVYDEQYLKNNNEQLLKQIRTQGRIDRKTEKLIKEKIISNCQPFLKEIDNRVAKYLLFRGAQSDIDTKIFTEKTITTTRPPRNTPMVVHNVLNSLFEKYHGWKARNGLFVTGDYFTAVGYSRSKIPRVVFPVGNFRYLWNPQIRDLFDLVDNIPFDISDTAYNYGDEETRSTIIHDLVEYFEPYIKQYRSTNLKDAINQRVEIVFDVERVYLLKYYDETNYLLHELQDYLLSQ